MTTTVVRTVDDLLAAARTRLNRLDPWEAFQAAGEGAVLVDTRPQLNRELEGVIPGALIIERNVLEWRFDPTADLRVIVFCNEGYASSLAAASLQDLGVHRATDMIGGYRAWRAGGLPTMFPVIEHEDCA